MTYVKVRLGDFTTWTRSRTLDGATDSAERIRAVARGLLGGLATTSGVRLLGVGVANFTAAAQEELFWADEELGPMTEEVTSVPAMRRRHGSSGAWIPGMDVEHEEHGRGWVWGAGHGVVTVRFETRLTGVGPVRSLASDDPGLHPVGPLPMAFQVDDSEDPAPG